jgi:hypothetical protein
MKNFSKKFNIVIIIILIVFEGCSSKHQVDLIPKNVELDTEYIVTINDQQPLENIFELEEIIPIHIGEGNFLVDVYRLQVSDESFYLLDKELGTLLNTSKDGRQIATIGKSGNGPDELPDIADFSLSKSGEELLLISTELSLAFYDLEGNFKRKIKLKNQSDMLSVDKDRNIGMSITYFNEEFHNFQLLDSVGKSIKTLFPFPNDVFPILLKNISGHITNSFDGGILYQEPANSVIFEISGEDYYPKYEFQSEQPMWPKDKKHKLNDFFQTLATGEISFPTRFFEESETHLYFGWNKKKKANSPKVVDFRIGVFDKLTNRTYLSEGSSLTDFMSGPMAVEGNSVYFIISLFRLLELSEEPMLNDFETTITHLNNEFQDMDFPVILKMSLKNH